nr:excalibur calcium-binding domain-containing protein [Acinetobacter sp. WCHAc060033]
MFMFYLGQVIEYHEDKGYGLLLDQDSAETVKFLIDDFPRQGGQPKKGETVKYIVINHKGVIKAHQMVRLDVAMSNELLNKKVDISKQKNILKKGKHNGSKFGIVSVVISVIFVGLIYFVFAAWGQYKTYQDEQSAKFALLESQQRQIVEQQRKDVGHVKPVHFSEKSKNALNEQSQMLESKVIQSDRTPPHNTTVASESVPKFTCDGRTHCSQMRSYEEAVFFIKNCPNTQMDGNHDGQPCEKQFHMR